MVPTNGLAAERLARLRALLDRVGCSPAEGAALAVLAAAALVGLGLVWWASRPAAPVPDPHGQPLGGAHEPAGDADPLEPAGQQARGEHGEVVVHVSGHVHAPGLYRLPEGARLAEAVEAAGGPLPEAAVEAVNLAEVVADGARIHVPGTDEATGSGTAAGSTTAGAPVQQGAWRADGRLDLNLATAADLEELPGVGPVLAERIIEHREQVGGFGDAADLVEVRGIGPATFEDLEPLVAP